MQRLRVLWPILLLAACGSGAPAPAAAQTAVALEVAFPNLRFANPLFLTHAGDGSNRLYVVEQAGRILVFANDPATEEAAVFLDIRDRVQAGGEMGLLGLAFDPGFAANGYFYVNYTTGSPRRTRVARFRVGADDPARADPASEQILLEFAQPFANHNGGMLAFGPDGKLYVACGDGGSANDPHDNGQRLDTLLGKILRLNPDGSVPPDNPFVGQPGARGEIWAYGLRNPWRMSFDRASGRLWAADVGQDAREEIDLIVKGGNYGWRVYEGTRSNVNPENLPLSTFIAPVYEYGRDLGQSVTGGYVYRGAALPDFAGTYFYADYASGRVWALATGGDRATSNVQVAQVRWPTSFGEDAAGELYITSFDGRIYRLRAR